MQSTSTTVTAKKHVVVFSADDIKSVALGAAKKDRGVTDVASSTVVVAGDGEVTVTLVEEGVEAPAAAAGAPVAPAAAPTFSMHVG